MKVQPLSGGDDAPRPTARPRRDDMPVVGMAGGGQLARMTQQAAIGLGVSLRVLAGAPQDSAARAVPDTRVGDDRSSTISWRSPRAATW